MLTQESANYFRLQLQSARENALKDAEAFDEIIHVVERLGSFCANKIGSLSNYEECLTNLSLLSPLAEAVPKKWRTVHIPFKELFEIVKDSRNDAFHIGAFARHLTKHSIELSLILEDALKMIVNSSFISDYMIQNPICAKLWQPISLIRQQMLSNSFTYLPIQDKDNKWFLISDIEVAKYLQCNSKTQRKERLAKSIQEATEINLSPAICVLSDSTVNSILENFDGKPILAFQDESYSELTGILTAFDLL
jgi:hypothetical protein